MFNRTQLTAVCLMSVGALLGYAAASSNTSGFPQAKATTSDVSSLPKTANIAVARSAAAFAQPIGRRMLRGLLPVLYRWRQGIAAGSGRCRSD